MTKRKVFCGEACREAYAADRVAGLIYGSVKMPDGRTLDWRPGMAELGLCPYCRARVRPLSAAKLRAAVKGALAKTEGWSWAPRYSGGGQEGRRSAVAVRVPREHGPGTRTGAALDALGLSADSLGTGWVWYAPAAGGDGAP